MGKCSNFLKVLALLLVLLLLILISVYIFTNAFKSSRTVNNTETELRLHCFVCETRLNFPDSLALSQSNPKSRAINSSNGDLPDDTNCLRSPKYTQLCQIGKYRHLLVKHCTCVSLF